MKTFLEYVAEDIINKYGTNLSRTAVVFPNKRAALFLNEHLVRLAGKPIWSPSYITISELFLRHTQLVTGDQIKLICDLYKTYTEVTESDETLDHFYGWGQVMLADFDDIDKNMADAKKVFCNLRDLHELDDVSYLSPEQVETLKLFFSNFSEDKTTELKKRFMKIWSRFGDIYRLYNERLEAQGIAYEGALYRKVATDDSVDFDFDRYIFVGFNVLQRVEQLLFSKLQKMGKAKFYWDFDDYYLATKTGHVNPSEAGHYIKQYLPYFTNELDTSDADIYRNFRKAKKITYASATTEDVQARYVGQWLKEGNRIDDGRKTAVVMCDEALLQSVIHSIPEEVNDINVTTGYPLQQTHFASLLEDIAAQHTEDYDNKQLLEWAIAMLKLMAQGHTDTSGETTGQDNQLTSEALFRTYTVVNRLLELVNNGDLDVDRRTMMRLYGEIVRTTSIPFHGEPVVGVQFMGVLETRNLDFEHLLVLSCNEGNMPKGVNDTSFIPYNVRKAHGLTTIDNKVSIYAYYFYRMMQRAEDITIVYNNAADVTSTGEMSRFMLQMLVESGHDIERLALSLPQEAGSTTCQDEKKTKEVMERLHKRFDKQRNPERTTPMFTPSSLNIYQKCPKRFYYRYVAEIIEPEDDADDGKIDAPTFGNIFHDAVQKIYERVIAAYKSHTIQPQTLKQLLANDAYIKGVVDDIMHPVNGIQLINASVIITYIKQLLKIDSRLAPFTILGLENVVMKDINVKTAEGQLTTTIGGRIDRMDCVTCADGVRRIRVIDYKTGKNNKKNDGYILQSFIYSLLVDESPMMNPEKLEVSPALLYIQHSAGKDFDPTVVYEKEKVTDVSKFREEFMNTVEQIIAEIFNPEQPFACTDDKTACTHCPYINLCGV
ncbi:MAG: PD-(D/E)XK nuclease family protein [Prevotellaceae bacterium]|nr:PD-(D/E)XK nuclease family protein [Prevotellaceae bacterium]MDY5209560.1 PD-(D/E)XK nuclease family protein [Prevotella sp.]